MTPPGPTTPLDRATAARQIRALGVGEGDVLMVPTSFRSLGPVEGGPGAIVDAFLDAVSPSGTVLFPTYNFSSWTENHYWDALETPSQVGAISEVARQRPDGLRTQHPIHSFVAFGGRAEEFAACDDEESFGDRSPFGLFVELDGITVNVGNRAYLLMHRAEYTQAASYRRRKRFGGVYLPPTGGAELRSYTMYARRRGVSSYVGTEDETMRPAKDRLMASPAMTVVEGGLGQATTYTARARPTMDVLERLVREHPEFFHVRQ